MHFGETRLVKHFNGPSPVVIRPGLEGARLEPLGPWNGARDLKPSRAHTIALSNSLSKHSLPFMLWHFLLKVLKGIFLFFFPFFFRFHASFPVIGFWPLSYSFFPYPFYLFSFISFPSYDSLLFSFSGSALTFFFLWVYERLLSGIKTNKNKEHELYNLIHLPCTVLKCWSWPSTSVPSLFVPLSEHPKTLGALSAIVSQDKKNEDVTLCELGICLNLH